MTDGKEQQIADPLCQKKYTHTSKVSLLFPDGPPENTGLNANIRIRDANSEIAETVKTVKSAS